MHLTQKHSFAEWMAYRCRVLGAALSVPPEFFVEKLSRLEVMNMHLTDAQLRTEMVDYLAGVQSEYIRSRLNGWQYGGQR